MPAFAQTATNADQSGTSDTDERSPNDIVVTARRVSERLQDVPLSITAFNTETLEQKGVRDVFDLQQSTPGLSVASDQTNGRTSGTYNLRGQGQASPSAAPGVVTYLNDVPVFGAEIIRAFFDLETVQVLKGPQGTLFGKNTNGGAILFNTKRPTEKFEGYVTARYGNLDDRYLEGALNLPFGEGLALRLAGNIERRDGFTENLSGPDLDNLKYHNIRATLRIAPSGTGIENLTTFNMTRIDELGPGNKVTQIFENPGLLASSLVPANRRLSAARIAALNEALELPKRVVNNSDPGFQYVRAMGVMNSTQVDITDNILLKNIVGYHRVKFNAYSNIDNTSERFLESYFNRDNRQWTEELQLQGDFADGRVNAIVGLFYLNEKVSELGADDRRTPYDSTVTAFLIAPEGTSVSQTSRTEQDSTALFAQLTGKVTPNISITAGFRYTWDKSSLEGIQSRTFLPGTVLPLPPFIPRPFTTCGYPASVANPDPRLTLDLPNCTLRGEAKFSAANYNISVDWKPSDNLMVYATHRHGYKSGGLNQTSAYYGVGNIYSPEEVDDLEIGVKADGFLGGMRYTVNVSGFHSWYTQLQLSQIVSTAEGSQDLIQNTGAARLWGGDLDVNIEPARGFAINGTLAYFDGKFTEQTGTVLGRDGTPINLVDLRYRSLPKFRWTLGGSYRGELGDIGEFNASAFVSHSQSYYINYDTYLANRIPSYTLLNARFGIGNVMGSGIDVAVFGRNLTDSSYKVGTNGASVFGFVADVYGEPRTYGLEATFRF